MPGAKDVTISLKVMIYKEKTKVTFAKANRDFVDALLSFLTLPLGKLIKVLEKHYRDAAPLIGSLNSLYKGLSNLDSVHFLKEAGRQMLLNPESTFEAECKGLKLNITYTRAGVGDSGGFTTYMGSFLVSDDLHILPDATKLPQIISILGITDMNGAEIINVTFGISEIMDLLKASLFSSTPLSDLLVQKGLIVSKPVITISHDRNEMFATSNSKKMILNVVVQKCTNKLLYAHAGEDFIDFLFSFLTIPLGGTVPLLESNNPLKSINNIYKSTADHIDCRLLKTPDFKNRLIKLKLPHGCISEKQILPLTEECSSAIASPNRLKFPKGHGNYVKGPRTYKVADDLTVNTFLHYLNPLHSQCTQNPFVGHCRT